MVNGLIDNVLYGSNLSLTNAGTSNGLFIDQDGNGIGLSIDSEATDKNAIELTVGTSKVVAELGNPVGPEATFRFWRNIASGDTVSPVVKINQTNATDDQNALNIQQDGTGRGIYVDHNGDGTGVYIASVNTNLERYGLEIDTVATGRGIRVGRSTNEVTLVREDTSGTASNWFYRNLASGTTSGPVMKIEQDNGSDDQVSLSIQQEGSGQGLFILQNGNNSAIDIDSAATNAPAIHYDQPIGDGLLSLHVEHSHVTQFGISRLDVLNEDVMMRLGTYYLWIDATGDFRIKSGVPANDTDGTIVGTQS